jgi:hypothetical protein
MSSATEQEPQWTLMGLLVKVVRWKTVILAGLQEGSLAKRAFPA